MGQCKFWPSSDPRPDCPPRNEVYRFRLLLLGIDGSGKSTFLNQVKRLRDGFTEAERCQYVPIIFQNIFEAMDIIIQYLTPLHIQLDIQGENSLQRYNHEEEDLYKLRAARELWETEGIRECFNRQIEFQNAHRLSTNAEYFLDQIERISELGYLPITTDIINARRITQEVLHYTYQQDNMEIEITDVGGGPKERRQIIQVLLGDLSGMIYLVAVDEYDVYTSQENGEQTNRLRESMKVFQEIMNHPWTTRTAFLIFQNKQDVFAKKLAVSHIKDHFPNFTGFDNHVEDGRNYFKSEFEKIACQTTYFHFTQATDEGNIRTVFNNTRGHILNNRLIELGLL